MSDQFLWWRDGTIYQIYPRSFADANGDGIGDLQGIVSRLDYLVELGVDAIWLSPIYPSPDVDFGYDVSDYTGIDPKFGSLADFDHLVKEAHQRGIRIVLDLVLNHTSDQHSWFQAARSSKESPYRDWYVWQDPKTGGGVPNNWASIFGGSGWEYDAPSGQYYFHMFYKQQPDVNWRNPHVRAAMLDIFRFWAERGVDGFRLDVFNVYFKDGSFRDNPSKLGLRGFDRQQHVYDCDQPEMISLLKEIRGLLDTYAERYAVGETFLANPEKSSNYCGPELLHAAFDFSFLACPWKPARFLQAIQRWEHALEGKAWPNYVLNNHDNPRSATRYVRGEDDERLKVAAALLLTQHGTPFLYYGEEIGMRDIRVSRSEIQDPVGKRYWPIYIGRDGCRSPMQWDETSAAGFGSSTPWLAVHPNYRKRNVELQRRDSNSLFHFYRRLLQLRKEIPVLREGFFLPMTYEPQRLLAYLRKDQKQTVMIILNFENRPVNFVLGGEVQRSGWELLLSNKRGSLGNLKNTLSVAGHEAILLLEK